MSEKNKIEIRINGVDYTIVGNEQEEYVHKIGHYVDKKMQEILNENPRLSTGMTAVLTAINIADEYMKSVESADNLRIQLQHYIEDNFTEKQALTECRNECERLKKELHDLQIKFAKKETELENAKDGFGISKKINNVTFDDLK